tara:strand:+ start:930 stop:1043 length:114 start_codon:yes stop_codon:yes gene_type:complete
MNGQDPAIEQLPEGAAVFWPEYGRIFLMLTIPRAQSE